MVFVPYPIAEPSDCEAIVVTCIDYRFQWLFERWLSENFSGKNYDRVAYAGGVKNWEIVFSQIEFAVRVHEIKRVILINHEDCKAYGEAGTPERHVVELRQARQKVLNKFPDLAVELYYARLAGYLEKIS